MDGRAWRQIVVVLLILAVGTTLRVARIGFDSLSFDEQWHMELSTGRGSPHVRVPEDTVIENAPAVTSLVDAPPWYAVWTNMDVVVHPPLYPTLLRLWRGVFGAGDAAARSFSIACSLAAIALLFIVGRELHGTTAAAWAAGIMAAAPTQVLLSVSVRGYALMTALAMAAAWFLIRVEKTKTAKPQAGVWLGLCVLAMMLTHYFAVGVAAAIGVYVLIRLRGAVRRNVVLALIAAAVVYAIAWGPFLWKQRTFFAETADPWLIENTPQHVPLTFLRLASWPLELMVDVGWWAAPSAVLLIAPLFLLRRRPQLLLWCLWIGGTLGFVAMLDLTRGTSHLKFARYVSLASPAIFMLTAVILPGLLRHIVPAAVVVVSLACWRMAYVSEDPADWRQLGAVIDEHVKSDETLIFHHGIRPPWFDEVLYLGSAHYSHQFPRTIVRLSAPATPQLLQQIPGDTAWLIAPMPEQNAANILPGATVLEHYEVGNLTNCIRVRLPQGPAR